MLTIKLTVKKETKKVHSATIYNDDALAAKELARLLYARKTTKSVVILHQAPVNKIDGKNSCVIFYRCKNNRKAWVN